MKHAAAFGLALLLLPAVPVSAPAAGGPGKISYTRQVRPLLAGACFKCHGPDAKARRADLRLDVRAGAVMKQESGAHAIVPGKSSASELVARIEAKDPGLRMPPASTKRVLSAGEIALLKQWIDQGAEYEEHWAWLAPRQQPLPPVRDRGWPRSGLDHFVLARLEKEGLRPAAEADRHAWIRRAALDLTGLPPTVEEVDAFLRDAGPDAYEKVADRLLASPAYGERWGRVWLDLARYADSAGYAQDPPRTIWRYRDWVIRAFNDNLSFDRFTVEQLAGDLLPGATESQRIATAFHRNTMTNSEGGTDDEEFRTAAVVDRVNTTMQVWMGLTMECAHCHSHKYDPISQEEYFRFLAVFNNTEDADRPDESPTLVSFTPEQERRRAELEAEMARLEKEIASGKKPAPVAKSALPKGPLQTRYVRVELLGAKAFLHLAEVQVFAGGKNVALTGKASQVSTDFEGPARLANDGNTDGDYFAAKSTSHTGAADNPWWEVDLGKGQAVERVVVWNRTDGGTGARLKPYRVVALDDQRRPLWVRTSSTPPSPSVELQLPALAEQLDAATRAELARSEGKGVAAGGPEEKKLAALKKELADIKGVPTPIFRELPADRRRKTHIHIRGSFLERGKEVTPGVPSLFPPLPGGAEANRLTVARWLVSPENPLTARVAVNRFWEQLFGVGLVETVEDFGTQGIPPSHPDLLDWLALDYVRTGWDTKRLLRTLVLSATYRQSSRVSPELLEKDPDNRLLARGPRFRLSAEAIRDQALAIGGLLSQKMYGPSVQPPRPVLGLRAAFGGSTDWTTSPGEDRFRRGLYTSWRRTTPYPSMTTFDAPSREVCTVRRIRTNTPLQALVTLNDPVFIEAAQGLARRMMAEAGPNPRERLAHGFRLCLARPPQGEEADRLLALYQQAREALEQSPADARRLATEPLGPAPNGVSLTELAAWTVIGNVLLNLDEVLARR